MAWYLFVFSVYYLELVQGRRICMEKELRKICAGLVRARDRTWFTELSDKDMLFLEIFTISLFSKKHQSALVLVHEELWWQLCAMIMNISKHFQVCVAHVHVCMCVRVGVPVLHVYALCICACVSGVCV